MLLFIAQRILNKTVKQLPLYYKQIQYTKGDVGLSMLLLKSKPRRIMVLGHEVTVTYRKRLPGGRDGMFNSDPMQIFIRVSDNWRSFLNHELLHAMLFLTGQSQGLSEDEEEGIVMAIETGMKSLLIIET